MIFTPSDVSARHRYIEQSMENTLNDLQDPKIRQALGSKALSFEKQLAESVVANVRHGVVSLPDAYDHDSCPLPVTTYSRVEGSERLFLSGNFGTQTPTQRRNTIMQFNQWGMRTGQATGLYDFYTDKHSSLALTPVEFDNLTAGAVGTTASFITAAQRQDWFTHAPDSGLTLVKGRPLLMLEQKPGRNGDASGVIAHELTHADLIIKNPVINLRSQRSADMHALREELEAYHYGFPFSAKELVEVGADKLQDDATLVQINVEWIRGRNVLDPADPFRPSGFILKKLQEGHVGSILHGAIDYTAFVEMVGEGSDEVA